MQRLMSVGGEINPTVTNCIICDARRRCGLLWLNIKSTVEPSTRRFHRRLVTRRDRRRRRVYTNGLRVGVMIVHEYTDYNNIDVRIFYTRVLKTPTTVWLLIGIFLYASVDVAHVSRVRAANRRPCPTKSPKCRDFYDFHVGILT